MSTSVHKMTFRAITGSGISERELSFSSRERLAIMTLRLRVSKHTDDGQHKSIAPKYVKRKRVCGKV